MDPRSAKGSGNAGAESPPPLKENPGKCSEEPPPSLPARNPPKIARAHTAAAVIHVIRTAARPANLISDGPFTLKQYLRLLNFEAVGFLPRAPVRCVPRPDHAAKMLDLKLNLRVLRATHLGRAHSARKITRDPNVLVSIRSSAMSSVTGGRFPTS